MWLDATRIDELARVTGIPRATLYYYFPGKDDVLREALRYCVDQAFTRQGVVLRQIDNAHKRMLALIEMQLPVGAQVRNEWSIWLQFWAETALNPSLRPIHNDFYSRWMDAVVSIVKRGQRQAIYRDVDPVQFARLLSSATDGAAIKILTGAPDMTIDAMRTMLVTIVEKELSLASSHV